MKGKIILIIFLATLILNISTVKAYVVSPWAEAELTKANEYKLIPGILQEVDMTKFITREELAELVVKLYEKASGRIAEASPINPFKDTRNPEVLKAYNLGITSGTSDTTFSPKDFTTREQVATMLSRVIRKIAPNEDFSIESAPVFLDRNDIAHWALEHVALMSKLGIIKGSNGNFMPRPVTKAQEEAGYAITTREQAIAMSVRIYELYSTNKGQTYSGENTIVGSWRYEYSAGAYGQSLAEIEFKGDGTFNYTMAIVVSSGSDWYNNTTFGIGTSSEGKYKLTGENKLLLYDIIGGRCEERVYYDNLYEYIERSMGQKNIKGEDREFKYNISNTGEVALELEPIVPIDADSLGFGLLEAGNLLIQVK